MSRGSRHANRLRIWPSVSIAAVLLLAPVVGASRSSSATGPAAINLAPTKLVLTRQATSSSLLMRNDSDDAIRFQVSAMRWSSGSSVSEMQLAPTDDLIFFPTLFALEPHQSRRLRVAASVRPEEREMAYRLMIEQLPEATRTPTPGVQMLVRASVPVFVEPRTVVARAVLDGLDVGDGSARFFVRNAGTVHFVLRDVAVRGRLRGGAETPDQRVAGWYLLPGESRSFDVPLPAETCRDWTSIQVTASFGDGSAAPLVEARDLPAGACGRGR